jgi:transportin-1
VLLPPLLRKYSAVQDTDRSLLPLLECISSIVSAIGPGFSPYVPEVSPRP